MVAYLAIFLAVGTAGLLAVYGPTEAGAREVIRWTARTSVVLLCTALASEGQRVTLPRWASRRNLLQGLAVSHTLHAIGVAGLAVLLHGANLVERSSPVAVWGGALAYVFIYGGAWCPDARLTSFGLAWIWGVFMVSYGTRALRMPMPFGGAVALLIAAMIARLAGLAGTGSSGRSMEGYAARS